MSARVSLALASSPVTRIRTRITSAFACQSRSITTLAMYLFLCLWLTCTVDDSCCSGGRAASVACTTRPYELRVSRSSSLRVTIVPLGWMWKAPCSSPAVIVYTMRPLSPVLMKKRTCHIDENKKLPHN